MISSTLVQNDVKTGQSVVAATALSSPVTFWVDCSSSNYLFLQCDIVKDTATNLAFKFENEKAADPSSSTLYRKYKANLGTGVFEDGTLNLDTSALDTTDHIELPVPLTGLGVNRGRVKVTVTATSGGSGTIAIQPVTALVV